MAKQSKGQCAFCSKEMTKSGLTKHLNSCKDYKNAQANSANGTKQTLFHILVYNAYLKEYWLHLEINGNATLGDLDSYLRHIWLECCGHLSMFRPYRQYGEEISMDTKVSKVFVDGITLEHLYDFGDTTTTFVHWLTKREGKPLSKHPIYLLARNNAPHFQCDQCDKEATSICMECAYEEGEPSYLCDEHANSHEHEEYGLYPIVNSPRAGVCGYDGPAQAPY